MRTKASFYNLVTSIVGQTVNFLLTLVTRVAFIYFLSKEYLGISSLFTELLTVFSLAELGVGQALNFILYKPLAENDTEKVKSLMGLYKKAYQIIGLTVFLFGVGFMPFYQAFLKEVPDIPRLNLIYFLYVLNTAVSYFYSYKRALIVTDQKKYIDTLYHFVFGVGMCLAQIAIIILTRNYIAFLIVQIVFTWLENFAVSKKAEKMYPLLVEKDVQPLDKKTLRYVTTNVKAMLMHRVGGVAVNSTDNLIITKMIGLGATAIYSNYLLIFNTIVAFINQFFSAILASVGNFNAEKEDPDELAGIFYRVFFLNFWLYGFCCICLYVLTNPFIKLLFGESYLFPEAVVSVLVLKIFLFGMRQTATTFRNATGVYYYDRFKPVWEASINLVVSIVLAWKIGISGVFLGTIISTLLTGFWSEPLVVYRYVLRRSLWDYYKRYLLYAVCGCLNLLLVAGITSLVQGEGISIFVLKTLICLFLPNIVFVLFFWKTTEFQYYCGMIKKALTWITTRQKKVE